MTPADIRFLVLHCSATRCDRPYSPEDLTRDHLARGFQSAGYHFYVRRSGQIVPLRPLHQIGAHVRGHNRHSWGICYEGGLSTTGEPQDTRTPAQTQALEQLLRDLLQLAPRAEIVGHRDLSPDRNHNGIVEPSEWIKQCPCFNATAAFAHLKK